MVIAKRLREKYDGLLAHAAYTNSLDAKYGFNQANNKATVLFVAKPYASIMESEISFTNDDIEAFYNEHKNDKEYRQERSRTLAYVKIPVVANSADTAAIKNILAESAAAFKKSKGRAADSVFAAQYAGNPANGKMKYTAGMFPEPFNTQMTSDSIGKLVGPVFLDNSIIYAKVTFRGSEVDSVQARHILFKEPGAVGRAKADSVRKIIIANKNFAEMAAKYGTDGTKDKGGDLGMFGRGAMVAEFENACFNAKVGDVQIVESQFGTHIVEVTKRGTPKPASYFAAISKPIEPGSNTNRAVYQTALDFIQNHTDSSSFRKGANEQFGGLVYVPNIRPEANAVQGIQDANEIITFAYTNEEGAISQPISVEGGLVVACVMEVREKGVPTLRNVYDQMKQEVIKHKKAEKYMAMMTGSSLEEIAGKVSAEVKTAENFSMNMSNLPGSGVG
jgi:peptidyl-prolyl cis-trans isomerase D